MILARVERASGLSFMLQSTEDTVRDVGRSVKYRHCGWGAAAGERSHEGLRGSGIRRRHARQVELAMSAGATSHRARRVLTRQSVRRDDGPAMVGDFAKKRMRGRADFQVEHRP